MSRSRSDVRYRAEFKKQLAVFEDGRVIHRHFRDVLEVVGKGVLEQNDVGSGWAGVLDVVRSASVAAIRREVRRYANRTYPDYIYELQIAEIPEDALDVRYTAFEPISLEFIPTATLLQILVSVPDEAISSDSEAESHLATTLLPLLSRLRTELVLVEMADVSAGAWTPFRITLKPPTRGKTVGDLYQLGETVLAYLDTIQGRTLTAQAAATLVHDGHAAALIGQKESSWLEVKSGPYLIRKGDPNPEAAKIELAQDVARFANSGEGAVIIVGMGTQYTRDRHELIASLKPVNLERIDPKQYRGVIDSRIYPPIEGLRAEAVEYGSAKGLLVILVPQQPEEAKPFLVHGAIAAGRTEGSFISIVRRRGDDSIPASPASIHAALAAGRALLRHGMLPRETSPMREADRPSP